MSDATIQPPPPGGLTGFLSAFRDAVRGTHDYDYTRGPLGRAIILLAIPMVLEMVMESVFALVDVYFVSTLGAPAVATVGLTESMMAIIYTLAIGLGIGATAMVARRTGEKNRERAARTAVQAIALAAMLAAVLAVIGITFAPGLLRIMGADPDVMRVGSGYTRVMLGGNATVFLIFLINAVFRGAGDAAIAMRVLWLANAINIVLDPMLILGVGPFPTLGVTGAAIATNIGRGTGVLYALWRLTRPGGHVAVTRRHIGLDLAEMRNLIRLSATGTLQVFIGTASWIGLVRVISTFGSQALAGYTVGVRIILFAILPSWGLSNAAATMVGQNLGARDADRAERSVWRAGLYNLGFLGVIGLAFIFLTEPIVGFFTQDPAIARYGVECLRTVAYGFPFYAYGMVLTQSFNGAGDTWTPTWLNFFCFWLWEIPLAWVLAKPLGWGPLGVFLGIAVAFSTLAVASGLVFRRGHWKERTV